MVIANFNLNVPSRSGKLGFNVKDMDLTVQPCETSINTLMAGG